MSRKEFLKVLKPLYDLMSLQILPLIFQFNFWSEEVSQVENIKSKIRTRIFELFAENNINIPFPQRVLHYSSK